MASLLHHLTSVVIVVLRENVRQEESLVHGILAEFHVAGRGHVTTRPPATGGLEVLVSGTEHFRHVGVRSEVGSTPISITFQIFLWLTRHFLLWSML